MDKKIIIIFIIGLMIGGAGVYFFHKETATLSPQEAAEKAINFINQTIEEDVTASLMDITEEGEVYKIHLKIAEIEYISYITKDGKFLFPNGFNLEEQLPSEESEELSKSETPDVKLFVMSYCSYGLQAQKMFLPVYNLLKDEAEMGVYFVNYIMHGKKEIDENLRQYCIQKEQGEKYYTYLSCFVIDGNFEKCLSQANIDKIELESCILETDKEYNIASQYNDQSTWLNGKYPKFDVHTDFNREYEVRGSPTVVINDKMVNITPRSPENFKTVICQAFNSQPPECSQALSGDSLSPGLGTGTGSSSGGSCQ